MKDTITLEWTEIWGFIAVYTAVGVWIASKLSRRFPRD